MPSPLPASRAALNWLRKGAGASLLADVAASWLALIHQALDTHPRWRATDYLRQMLTFDKGCCTGMRNSLASVDGSPAY
jgi:hypothetical protein